MTVNVYLESNDVVVIKHVASVRTYDDKIWFRCVDLTGDSFRSLPVDNISQIIMEIDDI